MEPKSHKSKYQIRVRFDAKQFHQKKGKKKEFGLEGREGFMMIFQSFSQNKKILNSKVNVGDTLRRYSL